MSEVVWPSPLEVAGMVRLLDGPGGGGLDTGGSSTTDEEVIVVDWLVVAEVFPVTEPVETLAAELEDEDEVLAGGQRVEIVADDDQVPEVTVVSDSVKVAEELPLEMESPPLVELGG